MEDKKKIIVEVCAGGYDDCIAAQKGGAQRAELNSALSVGGLTPSMASLKLVKRDTKLKIICMVRPRAAGFCYNESETRLMFEDAKLLLENGADGLAFGFLNPDGSVKTDDTEKMARLIHSYGGEAVFHRAFDVSKDPFKAAESLIACGVDRVLTSGLKAKAEEGKEMIAELQKRYGDRLEILAGSGVNAENAPSIIAETGISQVHSSCKAYRTDDTTVLNGVSYAYLPGEHERDYDVVDEKLVKKLTEACGKAENF